MSQRGDRTVLQELRSAGGIELDQFFERFSLSLGTDDPAEPPSGHGPGFGAAVDDEDRVIRAGDVEKTESNTSIGARSFINQTMVDLVGQNGDAAGASELQQLFGLLARDHPAGRIAR